MLSCKMAVSLRPVCCAGVRRWLSRTLCLTVATPAGRKWRLENNLAPSGTEYGPLTDLPDWSFADGRPAPH